MRAVVQRVTQASVTVDGQVTGAIDEPGLLVLVGVTHDDTADIGGQTREEALGPAHSRRREVLRRPRRPAAGGQPVHPVRRHRKGRRPTWQAAAPGPVAEPLVDAVIGELRNLGAHVETGKFGADMKVALVNDGPVTLILEL